jgi:hypothetical protein
MVESAISRSGSPRPTRFKTSRLMFGQLRLVREKIERVREQTGVNLLITMLQFGVMPDNLAHRNMESFASGVMPHLRN